MVIVSHDHYDHLEEYALNELEKKDKPFFLAGLKSKDVFPKNCKIE
jgi:L-ascorbate metabolism protein UlaG (beta-lactamase superfamily)